MMGDGMPSRVDRDEAWAGCYVALHSSYVRDLGLRGNSLLAFAIIRGFAAATGECTSTLAYFEWWLGCSESTARRAIHALVEKRLVCVSRRRNACGQLQNVYRLTHDGAHPKRRDGAPGAWAVGEDTIVIDGHMVGEMGLRGKDLVCYATLKARLQDGEERAIPYAHMAAWMGASNSTARRVERRLEERRLVRRRIVHDGDGQVRAAFRLSPPKATSARRRQVTPEPVMVAGTTLEPPVGPSAAPLGEGQANCPQSAVATEFGRLKAVVPTTVSFNYGAVAYRKLRDRGLSHADIEARVRAYTRQWRERYPDRETKYAPRCQRILEDIAAGLDEGEARARSRAEDRLDDDKTIGRALSMDGPLAREAFSLADARQAAWSRGDRRHAHELSNEIRAWCAAHRDEVWGAAPGGDKRCQ
jgi:hypothetical protein